MSLLRLPSLPGNLHASGVGLVLRSDTRQSSAVRSSAGGSAGSAGSARRPHGLLAETSRRDA
jgi:hypothetical protein